MYVPTYKAEQPTRREKNDIKERKKKEQQQQQQRPQMRNANTLFLFKIVYFEILNAKHFISFPYWRIFMAYVLPLLCIVLYGIPFICSIM